MGQHLQNKFPIKPRLIKNKAQGFTVYVLPLVEMHIQEPRNHWNVMFQDIEETKMFDQK